MKTIYEDTYMTLNATYRPIGTVIVEVKNRTNVVLIDCLTGKKYEIGGGTLHGNNYILFQYLDGYSPEERSVNHRLQEGKISRISEPGYPIGKYAVNYDKNDRLWLNKKLGEDKYPGTEWQPFFDDGLLRVVADENETKAVFSNKSDDLRIEIYDPLKSDTYIIGTQSSMKVALTEKCWRSVFNRIRKQSIYRYYDTEVYKLGYENDKYSYYHDNVEEDS